MTCIYIIYETFQCEIFFRFSGFDFMTSKKKLYILLAVIEGVFLWGLGGFMLLMLIFIFQFIKGWFF